MGEKNKEKGVVKAMFNQLKNMFSLLCKLGGRIFIKFWKMVYFELMVHMGDDAFC